MNDRSRIGGWVIRIAASAACGLGMTAGVLAPLTATPAAAAAVQDASERLDKLVMLDGRVIRGRITSETAEVVRMVVVYAGIEAPSVYKKEDILEIVRGGQAEGEETPDAGTADNGDADREASGRRDAGGPVRLEPAERDTPVVYYFEATGEAIYDIHPKPVRDAMEDAREYEPDYVIIKLDNDWTQLFSDQELPDDAQESFDTYSQVERFEPIFRTEIAQTWEREPEIIFWVRNAMGGICLLPFVADRIYFHPDGRMGGIGNLESLLEGVGDEVVRQKQRSLRLARAQGIAIAGGYDYRLVTAMARRSYELSYRLVPGGVELFEGTPQAADEFQLTDNGAGANMDTMEQRIRGETNDTLVLRALEARKLGLSSGTAQTLDDVLDQLGVLRNHELVEGRGTRIMERWRESRKRAQREIPKMVEEYATVQVQGNEARDVRRALGQQKRILEDLLRTIERFDGALDPFELILVRGVPQQYLDPIFLRINIEFLSARMATVR